MTNKTAPSKLRANAKYHGKMIQKNIRLHTLNDIDLLKAIDNDEQQFNSLVRQLLREHYKLKK